jgi:ACS family tartrate transporter-like MFS transporter
MSELVGSSTTLVDDFDSKVFAKCTLRIVGFLSLLFFFAWIDRVNVGFAALQMNAELKFSATVYGLGAGLFFVGYALFEVPSNIILNRIGARIWLSRIMVTWGIISSCFAFINSEASFYVLRFLLGAAEAGFVPGVILYLARWFPHQRRARAFSIFFSCALLAPIIGGPFSGWLMSATHGLGGWPGWRYMFIVEGLPAVILGLLTVFYLPDSPEKASWLSTEEKIHVRSQLDPERPADAETSRDSFLELLKDGKLWALVATYFFWATSGYGIIYWLPLILKSMNDLSPVQIGLLNALPFIFGVAGLLIASFFSDRSGNRKAWLIWLSVLGGTALAASSLTPSLAIALSLICVSAFGIWGAQAIFWTIPAAYLKGSDGAAAGIALVNTAAAFGGFTGPYVVGWVREATGQFSWSLVALASTAFVVAALVTVIPITNFATRASSR